MQMPAGPPSALELSTFSVAGLWARRGPADVGAGFLSCLQCSYPSLNRKRALFFFFFFFAPVTVRMHFSSPR